MCSEPNGTHIHWTVRDTTPASEGEPWNAPEAVELIYELPLEVLDPVAAHDNHNVSPEDLIYTLRSYRIDIREVFDEGGNIVACPTTWEPIRKRIHEQLATQIEEFHAAGHEQIAVHGPFGYIHLSEM